MKIEKDYKGKMLKKDYYIFLLYKNIILLLSPFLIIAFVAAIIGLIIKKGWDPTIIIYSLPILLLVYSYIKVIRTVNATMKGHEALTELKITLTDNEYIDCANGETNKLQYDKAFGYKETRGYFYICIDNRYSTLIIPKRFYSPEEVDSIRLAFDRKMRRRRVLDFISWATVVLVIALLALIGYQFIPR